MWEFLHWFIRFKNLTHYSWCVQHEPVGLYHAPFMLPPHSIWASIIKNIYTIGTLHHTWLFEPAVLRVVTFCIHERRDRAGLRNRTKCPSCFEIALLMGKLVNHRLMHSDRKNIQGANFKLSRPVTYKNVTYNIQKFSNSFFIKLYFHWWKGNMIIIIYYVFSIYGNSF